MLKPCAKASDAPFLMFGSTCSLYTWAWCSSGSRIMTMSAPSIASPTSATLSPPFFALSQEAQPYRHLDPGLLQVLRVRVALRAVAEDGDLLALDERQVGVFVVIDFHLIFRS